MAPASPTQNTWPATHSRACHGHASPSRLGSWGTVPWILDELAAVISNAALEIASIPLAIGRSNQPSQLARMIGLTKELTACMALVDGSSGDADAALDEQRINPIVACIDAVKFVLAWCKRDYTAMLSLLSDNQAQRSPSTRHSIIADVDVASKLLLRVDSTRLETPKSPDKFGAGFDDDWHAGRHILS